MRRLVVLIVDLLVPPRPGDPVAAPGQALLVLVLLAIGLLACAVASCVPR
jgi:hypothetical protein